MREAPRQFSWKILVLAGMITPIAAGEDLRMVSIGERRVAVYCDGEATGAPTVVLIPAGGRTAKDWASVQPGIAKFARVCSYDLANFGQSDKAPSKIQSVEEVAADLHAWLKASGEKGPFVLACHSLSGFYARKFVTAFPGEVAGLVFLDSSHEEQALRLHELDPQGPGLDDFTARLGFYVKPDQKLGWRTEVPLIVLGRGTPFERKARDGSNSQTNRMTESQWASWDQIWREFQKDLAKRSSHGEFRSADKSGHWIQRDQPELVVHAIRDVLDGTRR